MNIYVDLMEGLRKNIEDRVSSLLSREFQIKEIDRTLFKFERPPEQEMGDIAFACFPLAKIVRKAPRQIAETIAEKWGESQEFETIKAVGPYVNFFISSKYLSGTLLPECSENDQYGKNGLGSGKRILLEFSSPNTNKPLHLGHGRNNLLGSVLSRLFEKSDFQVIKANLVNDRGIHICKSMLAYQYWGEEITPEKAGCKGDKLIGDFYVLYHEKEKENPDLAQEVKQMLRDWEKSDPAVVALWRKLNAWVLDGFRTTYERMGIKFDKIYFESETYLGGRELVLEALNKGICQREENDAISIDLEAENLGKKILLRGDGTSVYMTQDINTTVTKFRDFNPDCTLFVVGNEQDNHFRVLFKVLEKFGFPWASSCEHISYGMISLPSGKMKSREGTVVDLDDLLDKLQNLALKELESRDHQPSDIEGDLDIHNKAEAIAQAALNFYILRSNASKEIVFNPEESLSFDGSTGPYLQYTHARICSLLRKAESPPELQTEEEYSWEQNERLLMVFLARYPGMVEQATRERNPAVICNYVYDLCRSFNKYYYDTPILKVENQETMKARLYLVHAIQTVLKSNLDLLGISALVRM